MKKIILFLFLSFVIVGGQAMGGDVKYQFGVRWQVNGLATGVHIQEVMLDFRGVPSAQNAMLPVTQFVRNGRNSVQLYVWPVPFDKEHEIKLSIEYWETGENPNTEAKTAFEVAISPGVEDASPRVISTAEDSPFTPVESQIRWENHGGHFKLNVPFNNSQPMPTWCWEEGDVLRDDEATRDSLTREYRRLHSLFAEGNNDALLAAVSTRTKELALASDTSEDYVRHRFSYNMFFDNPDLYQLEDFPEDPMTLNLAADNHVAWLTTKGVSEPIRFNNVLEEGRLSYVSLYFIRRNGQWEICR